MFYTPLFIFYTSIVTTPTKIKILDKIPCNLADENLRCYQLICKKLIGSKQVASHTDIVMAHHAVNPPQQMSDKTNRYFLFFPFCSQRSAGDGEGRLHDEPIECLCGRLLNKLCTAEVKSSQVNFI